MEVVQMDEALIITDHESSHQTKSVYLDENAGTAIESSLSDTNPGVVDVDNIQKILNAVANKTLILDGSPQKEGNMGSEGSSKGHVNVKIDIVEENEEEILELEFERAVGKMHTHNIYCPNCNSQVTRVILRRRKPQIKNTDEKPMGLLGCLSCFSILIPLGNTTLNPFRCFGSGPLGSDASTTDNGETIVKKGRFFDLFWIFGKGRESGNARDYRQPPREVNENPSAQPTDDGHIEQVEEDDKERLIRPSARPRPSYGTQSPENDENKGSAIPTTRVPKDLENPPPGGSKLDGDDHILHLGEEPGNQQSRTNSKI